MQKPEIQPTQNSGQAGSRLLLGATVSLAIIYGAGLIALGTPPAAAETGPEVVAWLREHRDGVRWFVWAITVSTPLNALVITLLRRLLPAPHRDMYLIGAVTILITNAVQAWTLGRAGATRRPARPSNGPRRARRSDILGSSVDRRYNYNDGAGHAVGSTRSSGPAVVARSPWRNRFRRAGHRDGYNLWLRGIYPAGWCHEFTTRRRTRWGLEPGLRSVGRHLGAPCGIPLVTSV